MKASMLPKKANNYLILNINNFKKVDNPWRLVGGGRSMWIKFFLLNLGTSFLHFSFTAILRSFIIV